MKEKDELKKTKKGASWLAGVELGDYLNKRAIAEEYFGKSREWLNQRILGSVVNGREAEFKQEEYKIFADALRDIARRFISAADSIDAAE